MKLQPDKKIAFGHFWWLLVYLRLLLQNHIYTAQMEYEFYSIKMMYIHVTQHSISEHPKMFCDYNLESNLFFIMIICICVIIVLVFFSFCAIFHSTIIMFDAAMMQPNRNYISTTSRVHWMVYVVANTLSQSHMSVRDIAIANQNNN